MRKPVALAAALFTVLALAPGAAQAAPKGQPATVPSAAQQPLHDITLITGDRVRVGLGEPPSITVQRAPGRERIQFRSLRAQGRQYLIPLDAMPLVQSGRLDRRLFDLTGLVEFGYTDDKRATLPLVVTTKPGATALAAQATAGLAVTATLPVAGATVATVAKKDTAAAWKQLATAPGIEAVWLDGLRRTTLEHSVPQIGAPAAYAAGFTGAGVRVAVLDTGVDATHPDLAGRVTVSRNFTEEVDGDLVGHGTHVASTVAGTGAASAGRFRGVAYGATILDGKVCEGFGCPESAILAGMEWAAAEQHADIVNMSLGGPDGAGTDPLEAAVDRLTAEYGTLFVIAAGNSGSEGSVGSPSTADAALSVGAVDRDDVLAFFSSRGPRVDGAIKPEITAPGVDIMAARAGAGSSPDAYVAFSGTSMATPHVVGAAALLAQQHPDWTPAQLKAGLVGSARPMPDAEVFDQGGGRVDVAAAIEQPLLASPATLSLGRQQWPHGDDQPVRRETTVSNTGTTDVTLQLALTATGPGGPAPAGMFALDDTEVTIPAGGSATVGVTADTRVGGPDGQYGGWLTATGPGVSLTVPVAVDKEVESYDVTFDWRGFDGSVSPPLYVTVIDTERFRFFEVDTSTSPSRLRLPVGQYLVESLFYDFDTELAAHFVQPSLRVAGATSVMLDARRAKPVRITVPDSGVQRMLTSVNLAVSEDDGSALGTTLLFDGALDLRLGHLGPAFDKFDASIATQWARPDGAGWYDGSPRLYATVHAQHGRYYDGVDRRYRARDFAQIRAEHHTQLPDRTARRAVAGLPIGVPSIQVSAVLGYPLPSTRTEYLSADNVLWSDYFEQLDAAGIERDLSGTPRELRAGRTYTERWNQPMFGPAFPGEGWVGRFEDLLVVGAPLYGDRARHAGFTYTGTNSMRLYRDGVLIGETDQPGTALFEVPSEPGDYRLEVAAAPGTVLSSRVAATWTFRSQRPAANEFATVPVTAVTFAPPVDDTGTARGGRPALVPVGVERQGLPASDVRRITVEASYDGGVTWRRVPLVGPGSHAARSPETEVDAQSLAGARWLALLNHPRGPGSVSLRATGEDRHGNTFAQTIVSAYLLR